MSSFDDDTITLRYGSFATDWRSQALCVATCKITKVSVGSKAYILHLHVMILMHINTKTEGVCGYF